MAAQPQKTQDQRLTAGIQPEVGWVNPLLYCAPAHDVINLRMVSTRKDLKGKEHPRAFKPDLVYQIFGAEDGVIYGYRNLNIDIYYLANSAECWVDVAYTDMIEPVNENAPPDNIFQKLEEWLPLGYCKDKKNFLKAIRDQDHKKMFGQTINKFTIHNKIEGADFDYIVKLCSTSEPGFPEFHERFQCLLVWFIDAASQIDVSDPNWMILYVYEKRRHPSGGIKGYYPIGFCTVYKFFHFPDKIRARIAQFFIIPPCQKAGIGKLLLRNTYETIHSLPDDVIDITVEDPCELFSKMRDLFDCQLVMQLESFKPPVITQGFTTKMYEEANAHFKLNKRQCRRVYELMRIVHMNTNSEGELNKIGQEVIRNIGAPYMGVRKNCTKKLSRRLLRNNDIYTDTSSERNDAMQNNFTASFRELCTMGTYIKAKLTST